MKKHYIDDKKDPLFYDSGDIIIEKEIEENKVLVLKAYGMKKIIYKGENLVSAKDFLKVFKNDSEIRKAEESEDWEMINNNWFEIVLYDNGQAKYSECFVTIDEFESIVNDPEKLNEILNYLA